MIPRALTAGRAGKAEPDIPVAVVGVVPVAVGGTEVPGIVVEGAAANHTELFRPRGAHSGEGDRSFRRKVTTCSGRWRPWVARSFEAPSGGLADLSIRDSRQACAWLASHA